MENDSSLESFSKSVDLGLEEGLCLLCTEMLLDESEESDRLIFDDLKVSSDDSLSKIEVLT